MADFESAVAATLVREGGFLKTPYEISNHGITQKLLRSQGHDWSEQMIRDMTEQEAKAFYRQYFWSPFHFGEFPNDKLAAKAFDLTVNMGPGGHGRRGAIVDGGITLLQEAVNVVAGEEAIAVDGAIGPKTLAAICAADQESLYDAYVHLAEMHYRDIVANNPAQAKFLAGWLKRLRLA